MEVFVTFKYYCRFTLKCFMKFDVYFKGLPVINHNFTCVGECVVICKHRHCYELYAFGGAT